MATVNDNREHHIAIDAARPGPAIYPLLYGIFWEELDFAGDGGLYAELVRNWNFETAGDDIPYWTTVRGANAEGEARLDAEVLLNEYQTRSLRLDIKRAVPGERFGVSNAGYWGIPVQHGIEYRFSYFARASENFAGDVTVSLESVDGASTYASVIMPALTTEWRKYDATLTANGTDTDARLLVTATEPGTIWLDIVSLFPPTYKQNTTTFRPDLVQMLKDLKPAFMRFPGGCYVQGFTGIDQAFDWKKSIGPIENRRGMYIMWSYHATGAMGYHEMLTLSEEIGAEPMYVCNCGQTMNESLPDADLDYWVQNALDAIEYANGPVTSTWGAVRAANGHPEPFNMKIVQIGNEDAVPRFQEDYDRHYRMFRKAILDRYPEMKLIQSVNHLTDDPEWNGQPTDYVDHHFYRSPDWFFLNDRKYDDYPRDHPAVFLGEVASLSADVGEGNLWGAIGEAAFLTAAERNADIVKLATYAPLLRNVNWRNWNPNMIMFDNHRVYGIPSYYLWQMFMANTGDTYLPCTISDNVVVRELLLSGTVGVGTWATDAEFTGIELVSHSGHRLTEDFSAGCDRWTPVRGNWSTADGVYRQEGREQRSWSHFQDLGAADYSYKLRARRIAGDEGFQIPFSVNGNTGFLWNIGGWGNTRCSLMKIAGEGLLEIGNSVPIAIEDNRWYDLHMTVKDSIIRCYLDGEMLHEYAVIPEEVPMLFASANRFTDTGDVIVKLVNSTREARTANLSLSGLRTLSSIGEAIVLTSTDRQDENSFAKPRKVAPYTKPIDNVAPEFAYELPPYSVTFLKLKPTLYGNPTVVNENFLHRADQMDVMLTKETQLAYSSPACIAARYVGSF